MSLITIKWFFSQLDRFIYSFMVIIYNMIETLAKIDLFSEASINDFTTRIYSVLGIFMLFKVSFSFINYIIKPDKFTDSQVGLQKIIVNILLVFVMLVSFPWVFSTLREFQNAILEDNIIGNFILGENTNTTQSDSKYELYWTPYCETPITTNSTGRYLSLVAFRPFFQYNKEGFLDNKYLDADGNLSAENAIKLNQDGVLCQSAGEQSVATMLSIENIFKPASPLDGGIATGAALLENVPGFGGVANTINVFAVDYQVDYLWLLSPIFGIIICLLLISFGFDIAVRCIKLGFLEIIAPVPIISYIEPDNSKHNMFKNWANEVGKTWISLFIRLAALYLAIYVVNLITDLSNQNNYNVFIDLFLLIGTLIFAKQVPRLIETLIPGLKLDGTFQLNPFKKIKDQALGGDLVTGAAIGGGAALATGLAQAGANAYAFNRDKKNLTNAYNKEKDAVKKAKLKRRLDSMNGERLAGTMFGGLGGGMYRGAKSGFSAGRSGNFNILKDVKSNVSEGSTVRNNRSAINNYNRELEHELNQKIADINADANISDKTTAINDARTEFEEKRYGFFERNVTERLDNSFGVKNEYGGYGYYNKRVEDLTRAIENNNQKEVAMRTSFSNYCVQNNVNQLAMEELHEALIKAQDKIKKNNLTGQRAIDEIDNVYSKLSSETGVAINDLKTSYNQVSTILNNISDLDNKTKELKTERKANQEMMDARQQISNNKK